MALASPLAEAIHDRFLLERELGRGGMATVYLARDLKHDRLVALKVLRSDLAALLGPDRFLQEIRFTARLQHPHILPVFDSGEAEGQLWYTMPYVEGESLRDRLRREGRLPVSEALRIAREVAEALDHSHRHGVVHRDIKPENILLEEGHAAVADFGIARAVGRAAGATPATTEAGVVMGSPAYMSPEQAMGETTVDGRTDIYALGCVLYEMLAGAPPLMGPTAQAVLARRVSEPVPHISAMCETVSPQLDAVIARSLACLPADRFTTAAEFARALESAGLARRVTVGEWLAARLSRRRAPADAHGRWRGRLQRQAWQQRVAIGISSVAVIAGALLAVRSGWVAWHRSRDAGLDPRRILLTQFENETGESSLNNVGEVSVDWLIRELQSTELVQVIDEGSLVSRESRGRHARDASFARNAHAGTMVSVAFYRRADSLAFRVRITETATGRRLYTSHPITAPLGAPLAGLDELSQDLVGAVITLVAPGVEWHADATRPPSLMAYKQFMAGLALLPSLDFDGATQHWFQAARIDTTFVTPLLSAASFMLVWGQNARADSLISSIRPRRESLQVSERHRLDNLSARLRGNIPEALAALQPLAQAAPASEAAWEYALHELWLNRPREATAAFAQLDPAWEFLHGWWFYWVFYCDAYHMSADFSAELTVARRGRIQYPNSIRVAEPELQALAALGRTDDLDKVLAGVSAMPREEPADRVEGQALPRVLMVAAQELRAHGHEEASARLLQRAQDLTKSWPSSGQTSAPGWLPAMISYLSGRWDEAQERYSELAARDSTDLNVQGHLGVLAARRRDRAEALRISAWVEGLDRPYLYGYDTLWRARIAALLGEDERAMDLLRVAFGQGLKFVGTFVGDAPARTWGPWLHRDIDFESLRHSPAWQELMQGQD